MQLTIYSSSIMCFLYVEEYCGVDFCLLIKFWIISTSGVMNLTFVFIWPMCQGEVFYTLLKEIKKEIMYNSFSIWFYSWMLHVLMFVCMYVCLPMYVYVCVCMYACVSVDVYVCLYVGLHECVYANMHLVY